ncbi:MAG TPA: hypothetical protein VFQ22_08505 [Longimicrobiales bacterium]|nr:hypothetical protein [Longimicrobiales bacterium]
MTDRVSIWTVDHLEGEVALMVEEDSGTSLEVFRYTLPGAVRAGDVLLVPTSPAGAPDWESAVPDEGLRRRRIEEAHEARDRVLRRDVGAA